MNPPPAEPKRILFLFSDTGGGHRSAANSIIEAINLEFPGKLHCEMVDFFTDYAPRPLNLAPKLYPPLSRMTRLWGAGYAISDGKRRTRAVYNMLWPYLRRSLKRLLTEHPCDLVVSVHQLPNVPLSRIAPHLRIPMVTVVLDLISTHSAWFAPRADLIIVPTQQAFQSGLKNGVDAHKMKVIGLPVAEKFRQPRGDRGEIRRKLSWESNLPVVLMVGGGEGMGPLEKMADAINEAHLPVGLAIVCGRNDGLREKLSSKNWNMPVHLYGFVNEMPDLMHAADVLITKAGPGTINEAFIAGLPMILYSQLSGQEEGNADFVVNAGAGIWAPQPDQLVQALRTWLEQPALRDEAARVARQHARPDATRQIARLLAKKAGVRLDHP